MSKRSMARATVIVAILGVLSKIMGFMREQLIAWFFGATGLTDAYLIALAIPTVLTGVISNPVSTAFLPVFASYVAKGDRKGASKLASSVITLSVGIFLLAGIVAIPFAPKLVGLFAPGFSGKVFDSAVTLTRLFFLAFALPLLAALYKVMLNTHKQFSIPGIGPFVQNLAIVGFVVLLVPVFGLPGLAIATIVGYLAHLLVQLPSVRKLGFSFSPSIKIDEGMKRVLNLSLPLVVGGLATQMYTMLDKRLASGLSTGSISALSFADRLRLLPMDLFVSAVVTVIYPSLSEMWARKDKEGMGDTLLTGVRYALFICIPAALGLSVLAKPIVRLTFERGAFTSGATLATASALSVYSFGITALALSRIIGVAFYSSQDTWRPVILAFGTAALNIGLDLVLVGPFGHVGLAFANVLAAWAGALFGLVLYTKYISKISVKELLQSALRILGSSAAMALFAFLSAKYLGFFAGTGSLKKDLVLTAVVVGGSVAVYLGAAYALKCDEVLLITGMAKRKFDTMKKDI